MREFPQDQPTPLPIRADHRLDVCPATAIEMNLGQDTLKTHLTLVEVVFCLGSMDYAGKTFTVIHWLPLNDNFLMH